LLLRYLKKIFYNSVAELRFVQIVERNVHLPEVAQSYK
jgi:hypothetical protein